MEPIIAKTESGWKCRKCGFELSGATDAITHASNYHCLPPDYVAMDPEGDIFDLRGLSIEDWQRGGAI